MNTVPHDGQNRKLTDLIRQTSFEIHKYLRSGFTEKIYENALAHRLRKQSVRAEQQECVRVFDEDGTLLGQKVTPLDRVGIYVPGGKAAYPSSVLMNAIPAHVAGVGEIRHGCAVIERLG